ncbi:kelch domain-containing protein 3 [Lycorma delicatula]|uniref:kelch domain-containing protein 3 n=1 Tax=Lycorma delicatula TaxID=130591 RepID=UPI003F51A5E8
MYWTVHLEGGPRRVNHAAVAVGDKIYSFGGYCTGENYRNRRPMDIHVLNTVSLRWKALPLPRKGDKQYDIAPYQRYGHTAVVYKDKIYIWGGRNDGAADNILYCFDPETNLWSCPKTTGIIPGARDGHSACVVHTNNADVMYIFGGFEEGIDRFSQEVYSLDFNTMRWTYLITKSEPPSYRDFHSATAIGTRMYIFGGRGDHHGPHHSQMEFYCRDIMYLDTITLQWHRPSTTGEIPIGRRSHSAFYHGGYLYIFGGYNSLRDEHFNDLHRFDPIRNVWEAVKTHGQIPNKRRRQSCIVLGDRMYLFGGSSPAPDGGQPCIDDDLDPHDVKLLDHDDLHVLEFNPSLKRLCLMTVVMHYVHYNLLKENFLPEDIKWEIRAMSFKNNLSPSEQFRLTG